MLAILVANQVPAAERQILRGHVPREAARWNLQPMGRLPGTNRLNLLIGLPLRNPQLFTNRLEQLYDPSSSYYHRWLTPDQIAQQFGPSAQDYQAVIDYVKANGLAVATTHADHTLLRVQGAVADIEKMLHVTMQVYQHPTEARTFYAPNVEPSLDLLVPLLHITGLNNFNIPHPGLVRGTAPAIRQRKAFGSGPDQNYWGNDFRAAYVPGTKLTGFGQVVGVLALDGYYASDIQAYEASNSLPNVKVTNVPVDKFNGAPDGDTNKVVEVTLDIDMVISMAPGVAEVLVYENAENGNLSDSTDILKKMQEDNIAKQLSCSFFIHDDPNADPIYQWFAMQGQSFFQCSGDYGAFYPGITGGDWADNPYVTIVGGTGLFTKHAGGAWASEQTWDVPFPQFGNPPAGFVIGGSGGGISTSDFGNYAIPSWQRGVSMSLNGGSTTMRNVPDVAMVASSVWILAFNGQPQVNLNGTSIAAPLWAGFTALVNEQAFLNAEPPVGFLNPALYAIAKGPNYTNCFHDITTLNNTNLGSPTAYFAVTGYDLCTGWGSPNGTNLINALMPYTGAIWVDFNYTGSSQDGTYVTPFKTLAGAVNAVPPDGHILIKTAGSSPEQITISKPTNIRVVNGPATVGN